MASVLFITLMIVLSVLGVGVHRRNLRRTPGRHRLGAEIDPVRHSSAPGT